MTVESKTARLKVERLDDGALWDVVLGGSRGNILDRALTSELTALFEEAGKSPDLRAVCLRGEGGHFSFGASVAEHLPGEVAEMLSQFHDMFRAMLDSAVVYLAAVRGSCLGGGLELASACHRLFASPDAKLGQPEIVLGVFAPVASMLLAERVGRGQAEDLCLSGRICTAGEAQAMGLVDVVCDDPENAALAYGREHLTPRSASSLRFAVRAARLGLRKRFDDELRDIEKLYLDELMGTRDAVEGLEAFLQKRSPRWRNA